MIAPINTCVYIFKRLRATAGQGPNYVGPFCGYVGLCWPMLAYLAGNVGPCCGYVGLCWPHVDSCWAKRSEKWEQQRNTVKRRIFWWSAAYLGAMLAHLGAMLASLGAMLAHLGAMLAHLGAMLAHLGAMLAHLEAYVGPAWGLCWPKLTHLKPQDPKNGKNGMSAKHRKTRDFLAGKGVGGRGRGPSLLRRGEKRLRQGHGQGAPGRIYEAYAWQPGAGKSRPGSPSGRWCCCCWPMLALFGRRFAPVLALGWPM